MIDTVINDDRLAKRVSVVYLVARGLFVPQGRPRGSYANSNRAEREYRGPSSQHLFNNN